MAEYIIMFIDCLLVHPGVFFGVLFIGAVVMWIGIYQGAMIEARKE